MKWLINKIINAGQANCARMAALLCLTLLSMQPAYSAINVCRLADGTVTFQDVVCAVIPEAKAEKVSKSRAIPFGIEKTWFDTPPVVPDRAICTAAGCHCGMFSRKFKSGMPLAIAEALYLDGSWHRLDSTILQLEQTTLSSIAKADLRKVRDESACNILMSQKILRLFGNDTLRELRDKKRYAEDRGLDDPVDCDAGDQMVCEHTYIITIYERIQSDIAALSSRARVDEDNEELASSEKQ